MQNKRILLAVSLGLTFAIAAGCGGDDSSSPTTTEDGGLDAPTSSSGSGSSTSSSSSGSSGSSSSSSSSSGSSSSSSSSSSGSSGGDAAADGNTGRDAGNEGGGSGGDAGDGGAEGSLVISDGGGGSPAAPSWNPNGTYTNTFDDEFNRTSINSSVWETCFNCNLGVSGMSAPVNSLEQACYASVNDSEPGDGNLHMTLTNQPSTCGSSEPYTGAELDSKWAFSQTEGSFEARVYIPANGGQAAAWPAWWLTNTSTGDEIDIIEGLSGHTAAHTHWYVNSQLQSFGCTSAAPATGWHNLGVSVNTAAGTATFYYDGTQLCPLSYGGTSALHLTFDNSIGASSVQPTSFPDTMLVDWVRVWAQP